MNKKKIIIVTGTGGILGTGHFQRMTNLAVSINKKKNLSASIFLPYNNSYNKHTVTEKFKDILTDNIPKDTDLIIRDMRDSSVAEIENLKTTATVLAIDDIGEGKDSADYKLYLLPTTLESSNNIKLSHELFLYGYNFIQAIESLKEKISVNKDIDTAIYLGYDPDKELVSKIKNSINKNLSAILLSNGGATSLTDRLIPHDIQYGEVLCRSKILITHFGITMFEGHICGCKIAALNPSAYHSALTDIIYDDFNILYMSDYTSFAADEMFNIINQNLKIINDKVITIDNILTKINSGNENFIKYIKKILSVR
ncbi:MAG: hypothetical protein FWF73_03245 [Spirochaetes bacterium]|nr:hypothetical protein [Spirochaetota bacterium]